MDIISQLRTMNNTYKGRVWIVEEPHPHAGEKVQFIEFAYTPVGWGVHVKGENNNFIVYDRSMLRDV